MIEEKSSIHLISVGGSVMHNLAIMFHRQGHKVTGSDDAIYSPSKEKLSEEGLLPESMGWDESRIHADLDLVVVGNHAKEDNPELLKAKELGLRIVSFPELIYQNSKHKHRIVVAGSHGKTTVTTMVMHVLRKYGQDFDYLVGTEVEGFDLPVRLTKNAPILLVEGDEYSTAPWDKKPKFLHYHHHCAIITGIAWDHMNVYPSFDDYVEQFDLLGDSTPKAGILIYNEDDAIAAIIGKKERADVKPIDFGLHPFEDKNEQTYLIGPSNHKVPVNFFGKHNMYNVSAAKEACKQLGITESFFYEAIQDYRGAARRLETWVQNEKQTIIRDFAHAPSKLKASAEAVKHHFHRKKILNVYEMHTYSSLNEQFLGEYKDTLKEVGDTIIFYDPEVAKSKKMAILEEEEIKNYFNRKDLHFAHSSEELKEFLKERGQNYDVLLLMSSGNLGGLNKEELATLIE